MNVIMVDHSVLHDVIVYRPKYSSANRYGIFISSYSQEKIISSTIPTTIYFFKIFLAKNDILAYVKP